MRTKQQTGLACALILLWTNPAMAAPKLTAELNPSSPRMGQPATLKIICTGAAPRTVQQERAASGVALRYLGESTEFVIDNGLRSAKKTFRYQFKPATEGQFVLPVFTARVNGRNLRTAPLKVTVQGRNGASTPTLAAGNPPAFLRVHPPARTNFYVGEMFGLGIGLYYQNAREPLVPQIRAEGVRLAFFRGWWPTVCATSSPDPSSAPQPSPDPVPLTPPTSSPIPPSPANLARCPSSSRPTSPCSTFRATSSAKNAPSTSSATPSH